MIPNETPQSLATVGDGVRVVGNFKITDATQARILVSLSDKMYTRKELAFIREYSTNAADAHIVAKKPISDIIVEFPTMNNLNFRIRDFGSGLTEEQIATVYCVFGESTKRNSNEQNGLLGYGCKAGFAHADSFTVTSWINGEKSIYQCVKGDSSKLHSAILLSRSASEEPTGIEITIPIKQTSLWTVHREAAAFYRQWPELPTLINLNDSDKEQLDGFRNASPSLFGEGWEVRPKWNSNANASAVAYMGWVPYNIDWNVLNSRMALTAQKRVLFDLLQSNDVTLFFKMGEVQFVDSRENLEYTELTINALTTRLNSIFLRIKDAIQSKFDAAGDLWEAKKLYNAIFGTGLVTVEKGEEDVNQKVERIKILDGDLMKLETVFQGVFTWNGVMVADASFPQINRFDNAFAAEIGKGGTPVDPVMITFRKKGKRTRVNTCCGDKNNSIVASEAVAVVINDTNIRSNQALISRYLIFRENSTIRTVHVLKFINDEIKSNFYSEYKFYTVPTIKVSDILAEAKAWNATHKVSRRFGSGGSGGGTRVMRYIDLETFEIRHNEVPIREMEEGGFYIETGEGRKGASKLRQQNGYGLSEPSEMLTALSALVQHAGLDLDKVFIVNTQVKNAKWFQTAVNSGLWKSVWKCLEEVEFDINVVALVDASNYEAGQLICRRAAKKLERHITDEKSLMKRIINIITSSDFDHTLAVAEGFKTLGLWDKIVGNTSGTINFEEASDQFEIQYPLLRYFSHGIIHGHDNYLAKENIEEISRYVNAMDVYVELTPVTEEMVAA